MAKLNFLGGKAQFFDDQGNVLNGGKVYFYEISSTTLKDTYSDSGLTTANTNPVELDSAGRATIWLNGDYKVVVKNSSGTTLYTENSINPSAATVSGTYNLIENPSFEDDTDSDGYPDSWDYVLYTGGTLTLDSTTQSHGAIAPKFTSTGSGGAYITTSSFFEVSDLIDLDWAFDYKSSVAAADDLRILVQLLWYDEDKAASGTPSTDVFDDSTSHPSTWTHTSGTTTPPTGARFAKLRIYGGHSSDSTSGSVWVDNCVVRTNNHVTQANGDNSTRVATTAFVSSFMPIGSMLSYGGATEPTGWLFCDGSAISRTTYADLFAVLSTTFGVGDGSTTFNVPDLRGRFPLTADNMGGSSADRVTAAEADTVGSSSGNETVTLTTTELPAHTHTIQLGATSGSNGTTYAEGTDGSLLGTHTSSSTGSGTAFSIMNPFLTINTIIKY